MGSVDIPPFMREQMKKKIQPPPEDDVPPFMKSVTKQEPIKKKETTGQTFATGTENISPSLYPSGFGVSQRELASVTPTFRAGEPEVSLHPQLQAVKDFDTKIKANISDKKISGLVTSEFGQNKDSDLLKNINLNDDKQISNAIKVLENVKLSERDDKGVTTKVSDDVIAKRNETLAQLKQRLIYNKSTKDIDEDVKQIIPTIKKAVTSANMRREAGEKIPTEKLFGEGRNVDEESSDHFAVGLNYIKDANPAKFKNITRALKDKGEIADTDYEQVSEVGKAIRSFQGQESNRQYYGQSYQAKKSETAKQIGEYFKQQGKSTREFSEKDIDDAAAKLGITNPEIIKDLKFEEKLIGYDAIPKSGGVEAFVRGLETPITSIVETVKSLTSSDSENYLRSQQLDVGQGQKVFDKKGQATAELPSERGNIWYDALEGFGQFVPQVALTRGIGGVAAKGVSAATGLQKTETLVNVLGTLPSVYLQEYGNAYQDALNKTGDPRTAKTMGVINAATAAGFELFLPDARIASKAAGIFKSKYADDIIDLIRKGDISTLPEKGRPIIEKFVKEVAGITGQELKEELSTNLTNYLTESIFSPDTAKKRDLGTELVETAKATAVQMIIPAILGGGGSVKNDFTKSGLHAAAINIDEYSKSLNRALIDGQISEPEYNQAINILQTHRNNLHQENTTDAGMERAFQKTLEDIKGQQPIEQATEEVVTEQPAEVTQEETVTPTQEVTPSEKVIEDKASDVVGKGDENKLVITQEKVDIKDEVTDEKTGERTLNNFKINFSDGARAMGYIENDTAIITGINAAKEEGSSVTPKRGTKVYDRLIAELSNNGITTIKIGNQSADSKIALQKLVEKGILTNPRENKGISVDEYPSKFDIAPKPSTPSQTKVVEGMEGQGSGGVVPKQQKVNDLVDRVNTFKKMAKNAKGRNEEINNIRLAANELGLKFDDRSGELFNEKGNKVIKRNFDAPAKVAEGFSEQNYTPETRHRVEVVMGNLDMVNGLAIVGADGRLLNRKQLETAAKSIKDGKPNNGAKAIYDFFEKNVEDGMVEIEDRTTGQRATIPIDEYFEAFKEPVKPLTDEEIMQLNWELKEESFNFETDEYGQEILHTETQSTSTREATTSQNQTGSGKEATRVSPKAQEKVSETPTQQIDTEGTKPKPTKESSEPKAEPNIPSQEAEPPTEPPSGEAAVVQPQDDDLSGIKKALVSDEVVKGVDMDRIGDDEMMAMGRKILDSGEVNPQALVQKIVTEKQGVLKPAEVVGLITYKRDIDNKLTDTYKKINEKKEAGEDLGTLEVEAKDLERQQHDFDVMAVITAQQQSLAFRLRQKMLDREYNVVTQIEKYKANNDGYIPPEVEEKFNELDKKIKEVKQRLFDVQAMRELKEAQDAVQNIKEDVERELKRKTFGEGNQKKSAADKAIDVLDKFQKKLRGKNYSDATGVIAFIDTGITVMKKAIKAGATIADAVEKGIAEIKRLMKVNGVTEFKEDEFRKDITEAFEADGLIEKKVKDKPTINDDGTVSIPNKMLRDLVEKGATDINELTDAVHAEVVKDLPDVTKRQVRDYITDYGKVVNPTADKIQQQVNTAKRVGRLLSELEDLQNKKAKEKNPNTAAKLTTKERELKRQIRVLSKEAGVEETLEEKNIKRLEKKLDDLLSGKVENSKEKREQSEEEKELSDKIFEAKKNLGLIGSKNVKTDNSHGLKDLEAKELAKIKALEKQLDDLRQGIVKEKAEKTEDSDEVKEIKEQIFEEKKKLGLIKPKSTPSTPHQLKITETERKIERLEKEKADLEKGIVKQKNVSNEKPSPAQQDKIDKLSDEIFELKKNLGLIKSKEIKVDVPLTEEEKLAQAKERVKRRIADLEKRIRNKDFAKKTKPLQQKDDELVNLEAQKEKLEEEFDKEQYKLELKNRTWSKKLEDIALEISNGVVRGLVASLDFSATLVQGTYRLFTDIGKSIIQLLQLKKPSPNRSFNAIGTMFRSMFSEKFADNYLAKIKSSDAYPLMQATKLAIDDKSGHVSAKEGLFISNWVNLIWNHVAAPILSMPISVGTLGNVRSAYNIAKAINPYLASQRAFDGYVNAVRVNSFKDMVKYLEHGGHKFESDPKVFEKAADVINTTTGRGGLGAADASSKWLNIFLFAPRKVISEVKLFTPYAFLYYAKLPKPVRTRALKDLATFLGAFTTVNALIWAASKPDEDDEEAMKLWWDFWNLNSSNFLTHKVGSKRISIGGGAKSMITFQSRFLTGTFVDQYGRETKLGDRYGKQINTRFDLLTNFIAGKTSPAINVAIKKAQERKNLEVDKADLIQDLTVPIWMQDLKDLYKDDPTSVNTILTAFSLFGANVRAVDERQSPFNDEDKKDPTFKYFLDKGMELPNVVPASVEVPDKETKQMKNLTDFPEEKIKQYQDLHKENLKKELKEVKDKGYVYIDDYGSISTNKQKGYDMIYINELSKEQLAKILRSAQVQATTKTKEKLFPKK